MTATGRHRVVLLTSNLVIFQPRDAPLRSSCVVLLITPRCSRLKSWLHFVTGELDQAGGDSASPDEGHHDQLVSSWHPRSRVAQLERFARLRPGSATLLSKVGPLWAFEGRASHEPTGQRLCVPLASRGCFRTAI